MTRVAPGVDLVRLSRPARRNALDLAGFRALAQAWREIESGDTRVAVITGTRDFSSGADLATLDADVRATGRQAWVDIEQALLRDVVLTTPVVSAVEGLCFGAGMELVGATDIRIAGGDAVFALPEVRHGFIPSGGSVARLPRQLGPAAAMQILLTGARFGADRLFHWGFLSEVVGPGEALDRALELAGTIAGHPVAAVAAIKRAVAEGLAGTLDEAYAAESRIGREILRR
ncbi:enoyl-CoA hydratase/isomerase family protein [Actinophytocola xinjiangensis]|uniref:enoyl-CoA hydratase/isomerase family protein n=1 Tax=Actinophytocola xinjiangensis TaxID=485602 RepID=UPI00139048FC|nr:enoyl-CoA hydratase/isomerase family protein [Actinophytocola xinjiangensis]